jgi:hypothetical protein
MAKQTVQIQNIIKDLKDFCKEAYDNKLAMRWVGNFIFIFK